MKQIDLFLEYITARNTVYVFRELDLPSSGVYTRFRVCKLQFNKMFNIKFEAGKAYRFKFKKSGKGFKLYLKFIRCRSSKTLALVWGTSERCSGKFHPDAQIFISRLFPLSIKPSLFVIECEEIK